VGSAVVLALVMTAALSDLLTRTFLQWEAEDTATIVRHHVRLAGLEALFHAPRDPAAQARWGEALRPLGSSLPEVVRCRVWHRDGTILWSDHDTPSGDAAAAASLPSSALAGRLIAEIKEVSRHDRGPEFVSVVDVHVPIAAPDGGAVLGVVQLHKQPWRLQTSLRWALAAIWVVALAGGAGMAFIAVWAARGTEPSSRADATPSSEAILAEVERRFGFVPPFFMPAVDTPAVLENLWRQTVSAYVENPLPALFKERLFAHLARYCAVPYCIVCHSCALRPLGMRAADVLTLIEAPAPEPPEIAGQLAVLAAERGPLAIWPEPASRLDTALMRSTVLMFLRPDEAEPCQAEVRRVLGPARYAHLTAFVGYMKTCFTWVEAHPELAYDADARAQRNLGPLLESEPRLREFFQTYQDRVKRELRRRERQAS
jgi:hypothetical protein